jgi:hypothetical protein
MLVVPSKANWITVVVIFFLPVFLIPAIGIYKGIYLSSGSWKGHVVVGFIFVILELYILAQRVVITEQSIKHRYLKAAVFSWKEIPFDQLKSWHVEKMRYALVRKDGLVMKIPLTLFMPHGSKIIYEEMEKRFGPPNSI